MLTELVIDSFKCFGDRKTLPLGRITLVFGPNSSGKSSLIQSMLLLKQTAEAGVATNALVSRGPLLDLGSFRSLVSQHDLQRRVILGVSFSPVRISSTDRIPLGAGNRSLAF